MEQKIFENNYSKREEERREINEKIFERMRSTVEHIRNAWMKDKPDAGWKDRGYRYEGEEETSREVCEFEAKRKEILVELMKQENIDFTKGYESLVDSILGCDRPNSPEYKNMNRDHRKFLGSEFDQEYSNRLKEEVGKPEIRENELYYIKKDDQEVIKDSTLNRHIESLGLYKPEYQLGRGLEKFLGGKIVNIEMTTTQLSGRVSVWISIVEGIGYNENTKQFFIKPETAIKDIVGRLKTEKIPTITTINSNPEFYKE